MRRWKDERVRNLGCDEEANSGDELQLGAVCPVA